MKLSRCDFWFSVRCWATDPFFPRSIWNWPRAVWAVLTDPDCRL